MKKAIMGTKIGMTQIFDENGKIVPVTVVEAMPNVVVQIKSADKDGYDAIQVGYGEIREKLVNKPRQGQFKKGFAGVIKKWNFSRGPMSHGSKFHRSVGSMGASSSPSRTFKNKKMPGRMGHVNTTVLNLEIVKVMPEKNVILIKGGIPGPNKSVVVIRNSVKA